MAERVATAGNGSRSAVARPEPANARGAVDVAVVAPARSLEDALRREFTVWMTLALLDDAEAHGANEEDEDGELFDSMLDHRLDSERDLAGLLSGTRRLGTARYLQRLGPESTSADRAEVARQELTDLLRGRMELFDEARAELTADTDVSAADPSDE